MLSRVLLVALLGQVLLIIEGLLLIATKGLCFGGNL